MFGYYKWSYLYTVSDLVAMCLLFVYFAGHWLKKLLYLCTISLWKIGEDSAESEGQKPALPLDRNVIPSMSQPGDEATVNMQSPESILSPVRKVNLPSFL